MSIVNVLWNIKVYLKHLTFPALSFKQDHWNCLVSVMLTRWFMLVLVAVTHFHGHRTIWGKKDKQKLYFSSFDFELYPHPTRSKYREGGGVLESLHSSVCVSVCCFISVSNFVWTISPEPRKHFQPYLVWWCIILMRSVLNKNHFTIFNVKVTARANINKMQLFVLYLLNCRSISNQT